MATVRSLVRSLPCRPSEMPHLRNALADVLAAKPTTTASSPRATGLLEEAQFLLSAQQHLDELNQRYFPQSGMTQKEAIASVAARVGFQMPKSIDDAAAEADQRPEEQK